MTTTGIESSDSGVGTASSADPAGSVILARGLTKIFKDFWGRPRVRAVDDLDFEARPGEIFGLLGPNGSGKSTTVKMVLGLLRPSAGALSVFGRSPWDVATKARIGYLPEESYLYRYLNAEETLDFYGRLFDLPARERRRRTDQLLDMVGLEPVRHRPVGEYSKGMARRIGLAQALVNDPDLVVLDEPTSGLDPIGTREVKDLLRALSARGKTIFLTSHLLADVEDVCDRVAILFAGRIRAMGEIRELLKEPDRLRIEIPPVPREVLERALAELRSAVSDGEIHVGTPTRDLESFFLDVVRTAREEVEKMDTAEVGVGRGIAEYLAEPGAAETPPEKSRRILERLASAGTPRVEPPAPPEPEEEPPPPSEEKGPDRSRLEKLATKEPASPAPSAPSAPEKAGPAKISSGKVRRDLLDRLSGSAPADSKDAKDSGEKNEGR